jgi:hypothetical protein
MVEFGIAPLCAAFTAGLLIAFRRHHSLKQRVDRLMHDHNVLSNRVLMLTVNRVSAEATAGASPTAGTRREGESTETQVHRPIPRLIT